MKKVNLKDCWPWPKFVAKNGYGRAFFGTRSLAAHRVIYEIFVEKIKPGYVLDHLCRNRRCVNPKHLEEVSLKENILRGEGCCAKNARKTHCIHGHKYTKENTILRGAGRRCRKCVHLKDHCDYVNNKDLMMFRKSLYYFLKKDGVTK